MDYTRHVGHLILCCSSRLPGSYFSSLREHTYLINDRTFFLSFSIESSFLFRPLLAKNHRCSTTFLHCYRSIPTAIYTCPAIPVSSHQTHHPLHSFMHSTFSLFSQPPTHSITSLTSRLYLFAHVSFTRYAMNNSFLKIVLVSSSSRTSTRRGLCAKLSVNFFVQVHNKNVTVWIAVLSSTLLTAKPAFATRFTATISSASTTWSRSSLALGSSPLCSGVFRILTQSIRVMKSSKRWAMFLLVVSAPETLVHCKSLAAPTALRCILALLLTLPTSLLAKWRTKTSWRFPSKKNCIERGFRRFHSIRKRITV